MKKILMAMLVAAGCFAAVAATDDVPAWKTTLAKVKNLPSETGIAGFLKKEAPASAEKKTEEKKTRKPRAKKKAAPAPVEEKVEKKAEKKTSKQPAKIIIQSLMGGEITPEEILSRVGDVDKVYIKVEENAAYWVKGDETGAINIW